MQIIMSQRDNLLKEHMVASYLAMFVCFVLHLMCENVEIVADPSCYGRYWVMTQFSVIYDHQQFRGTSSGCKCFRLFQNIVPIT